MTLLPKVLSAPFLDRYIARGKSVCDNTLGTSGSAIRENSLGGADVIVGLMDWVFSVTTFNVTDLATFPTVPNTRAAWEP